MDGSEETAREAYIRHKRRAGFSDEIQTDFFEEDQYGSCLPTRDAEHLSPIYPTVSPASQPFDEHYKEVFASFEDEPDDSTSLPPRKYRGFGVIPDLDTESGCESFYRQSDRGVTLDEAQSIYKPCSIEFVESLFEDYKYSFVEYMLHPDKFTRDRAHYIYKSTEHQFDRLQRSYELFRAPNELSAFRRRLQEVYFLHRKVEIAAPECIRIMAADIVKEQEEEFMNMHPTFKPGLPNWTQFLGEGAPGIPEAMTLPVGFPKSYVKAILPPSALAIRDQWCEVNKKMQEAHGWNPDDAPSSDHALNGAYNGVANNEFFFSVDESGDNFDGALTLPSVNDFVTAALLRQPLREPADPEEIAFELHRH